MAGIGFELKKIYKKNTVAAHIKGGFYSVFVTIGHVLITIGVLMVVNLAIGFITPPVGVNLFVACEIAGLRIDQLIRPLYLALHEDKARAPRVRLVADALAQILQSLRHDLA